MSVKFAPSTFVYRYKKEQKKFTARLPCSRKLSRVQQDLLSSTTRTQYDDLNYKLSLLRGKISFPIYIIYTDRLETSRTSRLYLKKYLVRIFPNLEPILDKIFIPYTHIDIGVPIFILSENYEDAVIPYINKIRST